MFEIPCPQLHPKLAHHIALVLVGTPYLINKKTGATAAFITSAVPQPASFLVKIEITDEDLKFHFNDPQYIFDNYAVADFQGIFQLQ